MLINLNDVIRDFPIKIKSVVKYGKGKANDQLSGKLS